MHVRKYFHLFTRIRKVTIKWQNFYKNLHSIQSIFDFGCYIIVIYFSKVLDLFGGIYTDGDVIYLQDTRPLWDETFAYRWSSQDYYNTAVMGMNKYRNLTVARQILDPILKSQMTVKALVDTFHPIAFTSYLKEITNKNSFQFEIINSYHRLAKLNSLNPWKTFFLVYFFKFSVWSCLAL